MTIGPKLTTNLIPFGSTLTKKQGVKKMKITDFNKMICEKEGGQKELTIAQVSEVIKIANKLTNGVVYGVIELMPTTEKDV